MSMTQHQYSPVELTYATVLLGAARRQGNLTQIRNEAQALLKLVGMNPRLLLFLKSPQIDSRDKHSLLERVFQGRFDPLMLNLLHLLVRRRRTGYLNEILEQFQQLAEQGDGVWRVVVTTAHELESQDQIRLKAALEKYTRQHLKMEYMIDPRLIGGLVCRMQDTQIDTSLRSALDNLKDCLIHTPIPAA